MLRIVAAYLLQLFVGVVNEQICRVWHRASGVAMPTGGFDLQRLEEALRHRIPQWATGQRSAAGVNRPGIPGALHNLRGWGHDRQT